MKKLLFAACMATMFLASCEKDPDMGKLDVDLVVYTDHDSGIDFGRFHTYYLPDSILEVGYVRAEYWKDDNAQSIISAVESQMSGRGYLRTEDKETADVGVQLSYLSQTNQVVSGGYLNGWWDPFYWGGWWGGWYYPFPVTYNYNTQALILEMVNLSRPSEQRMTKREEEKPLEVVWYASASGFQFSNNRVNMQLLLDGVGQAFEQSAYLTAETDTENQ